MKIPDDYVITVPFLREYLGLPAERPDGVRDLLVVPRPSGTPIPAAGPGAWQLALGDWPEAWRDAPQTGPRYLVMLHGTTAPYFVAQVDEIDPSRWGEDRNAAPSLREVPVSAAPCEVTAWLAGCRLETDVSFGWQLPEEQFAFI
jgi:hypothetical protein